MLAAIPDIAMLQKAGRRPPKKKRNKEFELLWKMAADSVHPRGGESYRQIRRNRNREAGLGGTVVKATVQKGSSVSRGALNTV